MTYTADEVGAAVERAAVRHPTMTPPELAALVSAMLELTPRIPDLRRPLPRQPIYTRAAAARALSMPTTAVYTLCADLRLGTRAHGIPGDRGLVLQDADMAALRLARIAAGVPA